MTFEETCRKCIEEEKVCAGDCCGIVLIPTKTYKKNISQSQVKVIKKIVGEEGVWPATKDILCVFLNRETKTCTIYNDRPDVCKNYGLVEELFCPYIDIKGNRRSTAKTKRAQRKINREVNQQMRFLNKTLG